VSGYDTVYRRSLANPEGFWGEAAERLHWYRKWDRVLEVTTAPFPRWFPGGETNLCYNAVDRHCLDGGAERPAIVWETSASGQSRTISYGELLDEVNRFAAVLLSLSVRRGDRVAIYLPMMPQAAVAMLACARIGAVHVVIFTGFGVDALAERIAGSGAKVLVTTDASLRRTLAIPLKRIADRAMEKAPVKTVVVIDRGLAEVEMRPGRDHYYADLLRRHEGEQVAPVALASGDPSYILYTAAATPGARGVVRDTGGQMVALDNSMRQLFDVRSGVAGSLGDDRPTGNVRPTGDVFWAASDVGWVVGHSYVVYGPLLAGITTLMFEGTPDYPDRGVWWRIIERHRVSVMFWAPTAVRMLRRFSSDHARRYDLGSLRSLFLAGEVLDAPTWQWASDTLGGRPVIDNYWLTESGWPLVTNPMGIEPLPVKPGSATKPAPGYDLSVVDDRGEPVPAGTRGHLVCRGPLPPGNLTTLWNGDEQYLDDYWRRFPGERFFDTGDYAVADEDGYLTLLGRSDGVLNVAAHRMSIAEIERAITAHPAVTEVCVVGVADAIKGEEPVAFVVVKPESDPSSHLRVEIKNTVRDSLGAFAAPRTILFVPKLPKTKRGDYMRNVLRAVCEQRDTESFDIEEAGADPAEVAAAFAEMRRLVG